MPEGERVARPEPQVLTGRPPCYYYEECATRAEVECGGRAVCGECAARMGRPTIPLRAQTTPMAVRNGYQMAAELQMIEPGGLNASEGSWYRFAGTPIGPIHVSRKPPEE